MLGSRAWRALMWRNAIYRKRHWLATLLELLLPIVFVGFLVWIRNTQVDNDSDNPASRIVNATIPDDFYAYTPLSFQDYATALNAQRLCTYQPASGSFTAQPTASSSSSNNANSSKLEFGITGMALQGANWMVPMIKCDPSACQNVSQDATKMCEFSILAVSSTGGTGGMKRAQDFAAWVYDYYYPLLNKTSTTTISNNNTNSSSSSSSPLPDFDLIQIFDNSQQIEDYVKSENYGTTGYPKIAMALLWNSNSSNDYSFTLRQNSTNFNNPQDAARPGAITTPDTNRLFDHYARNDFSVCANQGDGPSLGVLGASCTGQYVYNGILTFQRLAGDYILNRTGTATQYPVSISGGVTFVQFPTLPYEENGFYTSIADFAPLFVVLGLLYPVASMVSYIAKEKELKQKELMKMMSVTETDIGWSWFLSFFLFHFVTATLTALVSTFLYVSSDGFLLWIFWVLTFCAIVVFCMALAALTSKSVRAVLLGLLVFFGGVFLAIAFDYQTTSAQIIALMSLHPVAAFCFGLQEIGTLEDQGVGLQMTTIGASDTVGGYTFTNCYISLIVDCFLWGFITYYLNRVITPDYGQALPFYFPFLPSYWCPSRVSRKRSNRRRNSGNHNEGENDDNDDDDCCDDDESLELVHDEDVPFEPVSDALLRQASEGKSIEIRNLRKSFGDKIAVDGLSLSIYAGQVTALLGHNGAGKTTTINMLTGAMSPTSGCAKVAGKDVLTQMSAVRQDLGICLQHDCLFPMLTVREHVSFFAQIKGLYARNDGKSRAEKQAEVDQAIIDVALGEKRNTLAQNLSGGMKRKLSVAIAFCGGSKVVLLDEPTSGMDPFSRRFTWNVIRQYRKDRCIILTTHFMDEADILGDRIAIMAEGQLCCVGSSLFLKKTYGVGYQLTIEKAHDKSKTTTAAASRPLTDTSFDGNNRNRNGKAAIKKARSTSKAANDGGHVDDEGYELQIKATTSSKTTATTPSDTSTAATTTTTTAITTADAKLKGHVLDNVRGANLLSNVGREMTFQLPMGGSAEFAPMFQGLDTELDQGVITSYGVSITTLDEVFLLVARGFTKDKKEFASSNPPIGNSATASVDDERSSRSRMNLEKDGMFFTHLGALFRKRSAYFRRDKKAWIFTTVVPTIGVLIGFLIYTFTGGARDLDPVVLSLDSYNLGLSSTMGSPQNPIAYNAPDSKPYQCQPGNCAYGFGDITEDLTQEEYFFCGYQGRLSSDSECTISESSNIMESLEGFAGVSAVPASVSHIRQSSVSLFLTKNNYSASQYGAIWFTHDYASTLSTDGAPLYNDTVIQQCNANPGAYTTNNTCNGLGGIGYVIQYNFTALHVSPLFQSLADEALVKSYLNTDDFTAQLTIDPLPTTKTEENFAESNDAFTAWFLVILSFPFITGAFATFIVTERESKAKHLQTVAGVEPSAYWISSFLWDVLNYQAPLWMTVILMYAFDVEALTTSDRGINSGVICLLILFGPAAASFTYCITFMFSSPSLCNMFVIVSSFLIGLGGPLANFILILVGTTNSKSNLVNAAEITVWCLRFFPAFNLGKGLFNAINIQVFDFVEGGKVSAWSEPILLYEVCFLAAESIVYLLLAIQLDKWSSNPHALSIWSNFVHVITCGWMCADKKKDAQDITTVQIEDEDVLLEQDRVLNGQANNDLIVVSELTKKYDNGKIAVNKMSLGIAPGECFGLLGINGAGKTTTMGMLTAEFPPTSGDATLAGFSVSREPQKTRRRIGYCPQFDAHFSNLTGSEHVELYAKIKGIPRQFVKEAAASKLAEVGLSESDSDRLSAGYSGGMKRRLSLACATIGQPQIVFLDECSTGVDPVARREIWQLISDMVASRGNLPEEERTSVILTTHSMEECEALCPRIGIMANGRLRCLGSSQHLKNKFGQGYQVELKVKLVVPEDEDYIRNATVLARTKGVNFGDEETHHTMTIAESEEVFFNLDEVKTAIRALTAAIADPLVAGEEDDGTYLVNMITAESPLGYNVWKNATSGAGMEPLDELAAFCTSELRMRKMAKFIKLNFPTCILRERQDHKARYEVPSEGVRISSIFATIETNKEDLFLEDYGVSQTSLEQVFNMHAAEAERLKEGRDDA